MSNIPRHVAIIMDGNGRWARARNLPRAMGHRAGVERLRTVIRQSSDVGIEVLSVYAFSTENWSRPKPEVDALMGLLIEFMKNELDALNRENVRIVFIGDTSAMSDKVQAAIGLARDKTCRNTGLILNIALNYGGRGELVLAAQALALQVSQGILRAQEITQAHLQSALYTAKLPDPDVIIRTGGEQRMSNFMLYQAAYAELIFTQAYFPDFDESNYLQCLEEYASRTRRFGGL